MLQALAFSRMAASERAMKSSDGPARWWKIKPSLIENFQNHESRMSSCRALASTMMRAALRRTVPHKRDGRECSNGFQQCIRVLQRRRIQISTTPANSNVDALSPDTSPPGTATTGIIHRSFSLYITYSSLPRHHLRHSRIT